MFPAIKFQTPVTILETTKANYVKFKNEFLIVLHVVHLPNSSI